METIWATVSTQKNLLILIEMHAINQKLKDMSKFNLLPNRKTITYQTIAAAIRNLKFDAKKNYQQPNKRFNEISNQNRRTLLN